MTSSIHLPRVFDGYSDCRVVWYSHESTSIPDVFPQGQAQLNQGDLALVNLGNLREAIELGVSNGRTLETGGESDIENAGWSKDTASPAGVFSLTLKLRQNYIEMIRPSDVFLVFMNHEKRTLETLISVISIDTVGETRVVDGSGATVVMALVQGRDLGKILMETPLVWDPAFQALEILGKGRFYSEFLRVFQLKSFVGGPSRVIQAFLSMFFSIKPTTITRAIGKQGDSRRGDVGTINQWRFPGHPTASLFSLIDTKSFMQAPMVGAALANASALVSAANLWQLCSLHANGLVNEFFIDVRDLVPGFDDSMNRAAIFAQRFLQKHRQTRG